MRARTIGNTIFLAGLILWPLSVAQPAQKTPAKSISTTITLHLPNGTTSSTPATGPAGMTVERAMQSAGLKYNVTYFKGLGYALMQVMGQPPQTSGDFTAGSPFWFLCVDDLNPNMGMSSKRLRNGDRVDWYWVTGSLGKCPKDGPSPKQK